MSQTLVPSPTAPKRRAIPWLYNGDHLKSAEFERRYEAMPEGTKAELIQGIVFMSPPVRYQSHGKPHSHLNAWLVYYASKTPGLLEYADNATVRLDDANNPQPDLSLLLPRHLGGKAIVDQDDYISGPPALACEIAGSSVNIDLHQKKDTYAASGVFEYLVWRTEEDVIDWFVLEGNQYVPLIREADGTWRSKVFPGLWLNPAHLINADMAAVFQLLDLSTSTPEHAEFVRQLSAK
jgi:hypothetical protein